MSSHRGHSSCHAAADYVVFGFFKQSLKYLFSFSCPFVTIQTCNEAASNRLTKTISLKILACIFVCSFNTSIWGIVHWGSRQHYLSVLTEHQYSHIEAVTVIAAISNMKHSGILLKKCRRWYAKITHVCLTMEKKRVFFYEAHIAVEQHPYITGTKWKPLMLK